MRFSADGQNIAQNCTIMRVVVTMLYWTAVSPQEADLQPILREKVEIAVASLKKGKSAGVNNIPAERVKAGGETMIDVLTEICNRIWRTGECHLYHLCCSKKKYTWTFANSVNPDQKPHVSESVVPCRNYLSRHFWTKFLSEKN